MNERSHSWDPPKDVAETLLNLDKGFIALTTDIKVNYLSQISVDTGEIVATGNIDKLGRKVIFVIGTLTDSEGKLYATATSTEIVVEVS